VTFKALIPAVCCLLLISHCGDRRQPAVPGVLRYRLGSDPPSLDPAHAVDTGSQLLTNQLFDGLVRLDPVSLEVAPALAESIRIDATGTVYTFKLRRDVKFHDREAFDADAVLFTWHRLLSTGTRAERPWILYPIRGAREYRQGQTDSVEGLRRLGRYSIQITLTRPVPYFLKQLAMESAAIVSPRAAAAAGDRFSEGPIGTGPFRFVSWKHSDSLVLESNPDYWDGPVGPERVEFQVIPDVAVALEKYLSGEIDIVNELPPGRIAELKRKHPNESRTWSLLEVRYLGFNLDDPFLGGNRHLRLALNHAVNKRAIAEILEEGVPRPAGGILPPGLLPGPAADIPYPFDPARAESLLTVAGYPGGTGLPELELWCPDNPNERRIWQFVQAGFQQVGIKVRLRTLEWAAYLARVRAGRVQMFRGSWIADYPDPHNFLQPLLHSSQVGGAGNYARFRDPEFDSLIDRAADESDPLLRDGLYRRAESLAVSRCPWIFLFYGGAAVMVRPEWSGYIPSPLGTWAAPLERCVGPSGLSSGTGG
jgi:peptide/nickel transport system substrate-binding protein/oligopeptide transport system substrate-binding protein